jgi:O-antigen ligase
VDLSVSLSYLLGIDISIWYAATLVLKLALVATLRVPGKATLAFHFPALTAFSALLLLSCWFGGAQSQAWMAAVGFLLHLLLTLASLQANAVSVYLKAIAYSGALVAGVYDLLAAFGGIDVVYGRYLFFSGNHPNLGSEIFAMGCVAACMSLQMRRFLLCVVPALVAVALMQGRAGLLVILLTMLTRGVIAIPRRKQLVVGVLGLSAAAFVSLDERVRDFGLALVNRAFLADDPNRGFGTGFVGRFDRWEIAWDAFMKSPIFGRGFGYYESSGIEGAHNFYMYSMVEFGLVSTFLFAYGLWCLYRINKLSRMSFVCMLPIFVLTVFNDRFINLNPYPFVMIVLMLAMSSGRFSREPRWATMLKSPQARPDCSSGVVR